MRLTILFTLLIATLGYSIASMALPEQSVGFINAIEAVKVPEPSQFILVLVGLVGLLLAKRR